MRIFDVLAIEELNLNRVHIVHQPLQNILIKRHELVALGVLQIRHRLRGLVHLILNQLRFPREGKVRRRHSAQQNHARTNDEFLFQVKIQTFCPPGLLQY